MQVSESADTNGSNQLGNSGVQSVSRIIGALDLQQFWPKSDLFLEYIGGGAFYSTPFDVRQYKPSASKASRAGEPARWRFVTPSVICPTVPSKSAPLVAPRGSGLRLAAAAEWRGGSLAGHPSFRRRSVWRSGKYSAAHEHGDYRRGASDKSAYLRSRSAGGFSNAHFFDPTDQSDQQRRGHR